MTRDQCIQIYKIATDNFLTKLVLSNHTAIV